MNSLSISRQIYIAVGCALLLLATLGGLSYLATSQLAQIFAGYKATAHQTRVANELLEDIIDARLAAFSYRLTPSEEHAEVVWNHIERISDRERDAELTLAGDAFVLDLLQQIAGSMEGYRDAFGEMTELTAKSDRIADNISEIGPRMRAKLTAIMDFASENGDTWVGYDVGIAQQELMRGRFYNERFLLTNDLDTFTSAQAFMRGARKQIEALYPRIYDPEMQGLALEVIGQISAYIDAAEENRDVIIKRNQVRDDRLDALGPQMRGQLDQLLLSAVNRQQSMGADGTDRTETTLFLVALLSASALCIGSALGIFVARHISGSVRDMADTMAELAGGNLDVPVSGSEQEHELGMMARALDVFKVNARRLQQSLEKERELNDLQRQFVSMVSHEFRTPLAIIDGNAQRLQRRPEKISKDRVLKVVMSIRTSVIRLTDLMESVLSAARMEGGRIDFEPRNFDIGAMITEICGNYADINRRHKIETDLGDLSETYYGDVKLLRQVMSNLVSNAVKYSPEDTTVFIRAIRADDGRIVISVRDQGVGIPQEEVDRLFERFFRASTSTGIPGTGIGLHLVKHLIDLHGGSLRVESVVGEGTTFEVSLPTDQDGAIASTESEDNDRSLAAFEAA